jgi:cell division protein FtsQ
VTSRYGRKPDALESADLRHVDGYAIRLRGVTTVALDQIKK